MSDNGPQYTSKTWKDFCRRYEHVMSSPHNPQGNRHAERAVQTTKCILKQVGLQLALMCYRATPTTTMGVSPAQMFMGQKIRTTLPSLRENLTPKSLDLDLIRHRNSKAKLQAFYFNRTHGLQSLPQLQTGDVVLSYTVSKGRRGEKEQETSTTGSHRNRKRGHRHCENGYRADSRDTTPTLWSK